MSRIINHEELLEIDAMSYEDKVHTMFQVFPKSTLYFEELYRSAQYGKKNITLQYCTDHIYYIEIYIIGLGSLKKYWEKNEITDEYIYRFTFCEGDEYGTGIQSEPFNKIDSDIICKRALPFFMSYGRIKEDIPLIIHDLPEFAKYALEYTP
jgi:hypothetical protein